MPKDGLYVGQGTDGGELRLRLGPGPRERGKPPSTGVRLFSGRVTLTCEDGSSRPVGPTLFAELKGTTFDGVAKFPTSESKLSGSFTSSTAMKGTVQVITTVGPDGKPLKCDTGAYAFTATRTAS